MDLLMCTSNVHVDNTLINKSLWKTRFHRSAMVCLWNRKRNLPCSPQNLITVPFQKKRYRTILCIWRPACHLSEKQKKFIFSNLKRHKQSGKPRPVKINETCQYSRRRSAQDMKLPLAASFRRERDLWLPIREKRPRRCSKIRKLRLKPNCL